MSRSKVPSCLEADSTKNIKAELKDISSIEDDGNSIADNGSVDEKMNSIADNGSVDEKMNSIAENGSVDEKMNFRLASLITCLEAEISKVNPDKLKADIHFCLIWCKEKINELNSPKCNEKLKIIQELNPKKNSLDKMLQKANKDNEDIKTELTKCTNINLKMKTANAKLKEKCKKAEEENADFALEMENLNERLQKANKDNEDIKTEYENKLKEMKNNFATEREDLNKKHYCEQSRSQNEIAEKNLEIDRLNHGKSDLSNIKDNRIENLITGEYATFNYNAKDSAGELKKKLSDANAKIQSLTKTVGELQSENENLRNNIKELRETLCSENCVQESSVQESGLE